MIENPVIAAVKNFEGLEKSLNVEEITTIFVLFGDICNIKEIVEKIKDKGKIAVVHVDLVAGLAGKDIGVTFLKKNTKVDGIISLHQSSIRKAREEGLISVFRVFLIDSLALSRVPLMQNANPDFIEILPGVMPKILKKVCTENKIPILTGGLILDKDDVLSALKAGACAISTTDENVWKM